MSQLLERLGIARSGNGNYTCVDSSAHKNGDKTPSMSVIDDARVYCHACQFKGDIFDVWQVVNGGSQVDALNELRKLNGGSYKPSKKKANGQPEPPQPPEETPPTVSPAELAKFAKITHNNLLKDSLFLSQVVHRYGYTLETVKRFELGKCSHLNQLTIPIKIDGVYSDIRRYSPAGNVKYRPWKKGTGTNVFWGMDEIKKDHSTPVFIMSGVSDRLAFYQNIKGFTAICPTTGEGAINANQFRKTGLTERLSFSGAEVFYIPDNDDTGRRTIQNVREAVENCGAFFRVFDLSEGGRLPKDIRKDLKDFFIKEKKGEADFFDLLKKTL